MTSSSSPRLAAADELTAEQLADIQEEERQQLANRKLLAEVLKWARVNGYSRERVYEMGQFSGYGWDVPCGRVHFCPLHDPVIYYSGSAIQPDNAREAVDVLVGLGILPAHFSSAFAAGRESLGDLVPTDERPAYRTQMWADDGDSWANWSVGRERGTPEFEQNVIASAEKHLGPWDSTCSVVRTEVQRFREVTCRVDMTVLGRFGDWSEVAE